MENEHLTPCDSHPVQGQDPQQNTRGKFAFISTACALHTQQTELKQDTSFGVLFLTTDRRKLERELGAIQKDPINSNSEAFVNTIKGFVCGFLGVPFLKFRQREKGIFNS